MVAARVQKIELMNLAFNPVQLSMEVLDRRCVTLFELVGQKSCYNGSFANPRATEHNQTVAIARGWFAGILLRGRRRWTRADWDRKDAILRA